MLNSNKLGSVYTSHHTKTVRKDENANENKTFVAIFLKHCFQIHLIKHAARHSCSYTSSWVQLEVSTGFTDCLPDSDLMKIRPVVLKIFHVNRQRAMAKLVHNRRQNIAESLPTGQVVSAQLRADSQLTASASVDQRWRLFVWSTQPLFGLYQYLSVGSIQSTALRLTALWV